jgi:UDP-2-acetamido-2,6-beta-L-arabino-hexul-4-ose reductase
MVEITRLDQFRDARGTAYEPLDPEALPGQRNVHVVITEPGHVRGNHVHHRDTEILTVRGPALVRYREAGEERDVDVEHGEVLAFRFPPGVPHAIRNTGEAPQVIVAFKDHAHDRENPDVERVVLMETD